MNFSSLRPVSGAPLWPYESLLIFTLNGTCEHAHAQNLQHTVWKRQPLNLYFHPVTPEAMATH